MKYLNMTNLTPDINTFELSHKIKIMAEVDLAAQNGQIQGMK